MASTAFRLPRPVRPLFELGTYALREYRNDRGSLAAAALAFYGVLSLGPLVIVVTQLAGLFLGEGAARAALSRNLTVALGPAGAQAVDRVTRELGEARYTGVGVMGIFVALYAASGVFMSLQNALNQVWSVQTLPRHALRDQARQFFWDRARSALLVVGFGVLLLVVALGTTVLSVVLTYLPQLFTHPTIWRVVPLVASFLLSSAVFAVIYCVVPDARVSWAHAWSGAWPAGALFTVGKFGMTWYVGTHGIASLSGTAAALLIVLLWASYSANVFLLGAEIAEACAWRDGSGVTPRPYARVVQVPGPLDVAPLHGRSE